ncbi:MAG: hypothetical protein JWO03_2421 [Bacteroidetes bacterium]|nr:hypothetical protein [Bacteroidota bacterium]
MVIRRKLFSSVIFMAIASFALAGGHAPFAEQKDFKSTTSRADMGSYAVSDGSNAEVIAVFIQKHIANLQGKESGVKLTYATRSLGGYHYTFTQTYHGTPIFSSDIMVNVTRNNRINSIFDDSYDVSQWRVNMNDFDYRSVAVYQTYVRQYFSDEVVQTGNQVIAFDENANSAELCYQVNLKSKNGTRNVLVAKDRILYEQDGAKYKAAAVPDSLVTGMVFRPDPLTTAHVKYYGSYMGHDSAYQNFNNADTPQLNLQRISVPFYANYNAGIFSLSNQYIQLQMLGSNTVPPVTSATPTFNYTRSQLGFIDVMLFYHLNEMRNYVHGLGFNMADTLVMVDSHATSADNDMFIEPNSINYGTGGVPDCQDADVIIHEYTHFLSHNANHSAGFGSSSQRQSIDEGVADYNAASYSAGIDTFGWNRMFSWDGHNEYWGGRFVDDMTVYPAMPSRPADLFGYYKYATTWASALMQIWWDIGKGPADTLFFETMYGIASNVTLPDVAQVYIKADSSLYGGKYHCRIVQDFRDHGLASDSAGCAIYGVGVKDVSDQTDFVRFTSYPDGFRAEPVAANTSIDITVYDIAGQRLSSYHNITTEIRPDQLPAGIYIIDVSASGAHKGYKWGLVK